MKRRRFTLTQICKHPQICIQRTTWCDFFCWWYFTFNFLGFFCSTCSAPRDALIELSQSIFRQFKQRQRSKQGQKFAVLEQKVPPCVLKPTSLASHKFCLIQVHWTLLDKHFSTYIQFSWFGYVQNMHEINIDSTLNQR